MSALLELDHLRVRLLVEHRPQTVIHDVSFSLEAGDAVGLVGESGSGKTMTARAIGCLLPPGAETDGVIRFRGSDVLAMRRAALSTYRTGGVALIFQDPRAHINAVRTIGDFLTEGMRVHQRLSRPVATARAIELLAEVGIDDGGRRMRQYPHELSGGLLQRVMIASALAAEPQLILADEPTTALDVTTQSDVMAILDGLRRDRGMAMLFITHDLELASAVCDRTIVMYAGSVVEQNAATELHTRPLHPYTAALVSARPDIAQTTRLAAIPGRPLSAYEVPEAAPSHPGADMQFPPARPANPRFARGRAA